MFDHKKKRKRFKCSCRLGFFRLKPYNTELGSQKTRHEAFVPETRCQSERNGHREEHPT